MTAKLTDQLKLAITTADKSRLSIDGWNKLAEALGLELVKRRRPKRKGR